MKPAAPYTVPPLVLNPDPGVPMPEDDELPAGDLRENLDAFTSTVELLYDHGREPDVVTPVDQQTAAALASSYASDPVLTNKAATVARLSKLTPASLLQTRAILDEFGQQVVQRSVEIRHMVTNKLVLETENPDPRVRIRALELLGKITDVGLFSERSEVTITHQSSDELRSKLQEKLRRLRENTLDAEIIDSEEGAEREKNDVEVEDDPVNEAFKAFGLDPEPPGA
jgi:hypothetical protein